MVNAPSPAFGTAGTRLSDEKGAGNRSLPWIRLLLPPILPRNA